MHSKASDFRKLIFTAFFSVLFGVAVVNQIRNSEDYPILTLFLFAYFLVYFIVVATRLYRHFLAPRYAFLPGDLLSVVAENGSFGVAKILAIEELGAHVRLYVQRFPVRPNHIDPKTLDTAPFGPDHGNPFSIGHMPLSWQTLRAWKPKLIAHGFVVEEELEGFRMWEEARGEFF